MRLLFWIIGLPVAAVLIGFAVANRHFVEVSLDPLSRHDPWASLAVPLWAVLFFGIFCGLVVGWIGAWLKQGKWRRAARQAKGDLATARSDAARQRRERTGTLGGHGGP
jgi:NhaP-type Na+/H+ or K+/H+ antiporter